MSILKIKTTTYCATCGSPMRRTKTITVQAKTLAEAKEEARGKIKSWLKSLEGQNCQVCASITASRKEQENA